MIKKILLTCIIVCTCLNSSYAAEAESTEGNFSEGKEVKITVTEPIPGADCIEKPRSSEKVGKLSDEQKDKMAQPYWICSVEKGTAQALKTIGYMIRYFTVIVGIIAVIFLVYNGILYSMGGIDQSLKEAAKKKIVATLVGIALLFLSGPILYLIAPWVFFL